MLVASYNPEALGDVLITVTAAPQPDQQVERKGAIVRLFAAKSNQTLGYNFFNASQIVADLKPVGQNHLTAAQVAQLNEALTANGFEAELVADERPKFVVGKVLEMEEHPDSDHLHITKVLIDNDETLQIVCGAPNVAAGQAVVVAKIGAMMPDGAIIFPGKLRGVASDGMLCAARELALPNAPQKRGILVLDEAEYPVGSAFDFAKAQTLFA